MTNQNYYGMRAPANIPVQPMMYRPPMYNQNQPNTNMTFVVSLDEAIIRAGDRDADVVFFDQNRPVFYRIKVDANGVKSWQEFPYQIPNQLQNTPASQADIQNLVTRLDELEREVKKYAKSDGQSTTSTSTTATE